MKRAIEYEEKVSIIHRIVVDCESEEIIDNLCDISGETFDDILNDAIKFIDNKNIIEISENFSEDRDGCVEYADDYWTEQEIKRYGKSN